MAHLIVAPGITDGDSVDDYTAATLVEYGLIRLKLVRVDHTRIYNLVTDEARDENETWAQIEVHMGRE